MWARLTLLRLNVRKESFSHALTSCDFQVALLDALTLPEFFVTLALLE
jgi:hypothetical protein